MHIISPEIPPRRFAELPVKNLIKFVKRSPRLRAIVRKIIFGDQTGSSDNDIPLVVVAKNLFFWTKTDLRRYSGSSSVKPIHSSFPKEFSFPLLGLDIKLRQSAVVGPQN